MAAPPLIDLLLVRSCRSEWDEASRLGGDCDIPAASRWGEELDAALAGVDVGSITAVLCGPDEASQQTAGVLGRLIDRKPRVIEGLREVDLGLWEGQRLEALQDRFPGAIKQWREDPSSVKAPQGEAFEQAEQRLMAALARSIEKLNGRAKRVAVVLRPLAFHVVRNHLHGRAMREGWDAAACGPLPEGLRVARTALLAPQRGAV